MEYAKVDTHAHITSEELFPDIEGIIERARSAGVVKIVNIATDEVTLVRGLALAKKYPGLIFNTAATTPHDVEKEDLFAKVVEVKDRLVAIGETGLDYYYEHSPREKQREHLSKYVALAKQIDLPVVIHCRDAFDDLFTFDIPKAVLHCFTGSSRDARSALERGWYISFSGIVTFKKSVELRAVLKEVPLEKILIETDAPYLAPQSKRGKVNEPSYIGEVAEVVAVVKGISLREVCELTTKNGCEFFGI